jgi:hypothetical protein
MTASMARRPNFSYAHIKILARLEATTLSGSRTFCRVRSGPARSIRWLGAPLAIQRSDAEPLCSRSITMRTSCATDLAPIFSMTCARWISTVR